MSRKAGFDKIERLFHELVDKDFAEQKLFLEDLRKTDLKSFDILLTLLAADAEPNPIFGENPSDFLEGWGNDPDLIGEKIGAFQLVEIIGQGAMGSVFRAERVDGQFEQTVAIKMLKSQMLKSRHREFFERERQILARLNHPGIARLYDGGFTDEGRPFFTMEWISGQNLLEYCRNTRCRLQERLQLFEEVCRAVHYAHQNLIAHLDLKPQNIIINQNGQVKLLDFGVSKLLEENPIGEGSFTLPYASPEQIRHEDATTASDIYALGVILFELLADRHPFQSLFSDRPKLKETILDGKVPGLILKDGFGRVPFEEDLQAICKTAMQMDPADRYVSVDELLRDVANFRQDYPVEVRARTWSYAGAKYFRRNKKVLSSIAVAAVLLISSGIYYTLEIRTQRNIAQDEAKRANQITELMTDVFMAADPNIGGADTITAVNLLNKGVEDIRNNLKDDPQLYADMLLRLVPIFHNLGDYEMGQTLAEESYEILHAGGDPVLAQLAKQNISTGYYFMGQLDTAALLIREVLAELLLLEDPKSMNVAAALVQFANSEYDMGNWAKADSVYLEAYEIYLQSEETEKADLAFIQHMRGAAARELGEYENAEKLLLSSLEIKKEVYEEPHLEIAYTYNHLGSLYQSMKEYDKAEVFIQSSLDQRKAVLGSYHVETVASLSNLGRNFNAKGEPEKAIPIFEEALVIVDSIFGFVHPYYAGISSNLNNSKFQLGDLAGAKAGYLEVQNLYEELLPPGHRLHSTPILMLAKIAMKENKPQEARGLFESGLAIREAALPPGHFLLAQSQQALGECLMVLGDHSTAIEYLELARQSFEQNEDSEESLLAVQKSLLSAYQTIDDQEKAEEYRLAVAAKE
ncbi:protein kinase domain-containing protein [Algoriphagus namhaensis]